MIIETEKVRTACGLNYPGLSTRTNIVSICKVLEMVLSFMMVFHVSRQREMGIGSDPVSKLILESNSIVKRGFDSKIGSGSSRDGDKVKIDRNALMRMKAGKTLENAWLFFHEMIGQH